MLEDQLLEQKINGCKGRYESLSARIEALTKSYDLETRPEEKLRLRPVLEECEQERQALEQEWRSLEAEQAKLEKPRLLQEARHLERNKAFKEALDVWKKIRNLAPDEPQAAAEIWRLEERLQRSQRLTDTIKQLTRRLTEIKPIYQTVITRLRQMGETGVVDEDVVGIVDDFLQGNLSADDFMEAWGALIPASATDEPDYRALADRLKRGEIVLFLGSDISRLLNSAAPIPDIVPELAQQANYQGYSGSLSMLAEYYQMKPEYGRSSLVRNLRAIIATTVPEISLYRLLARIDQPLVLISVNCDMYLEQQLQQSGRKYALISSVICGTPECEIGSVVVQYSDREASEFLRLEQGLSSLKLIEGGYSLIYKICGYYSSQSDQTDYQHNILTLAEDNYFTFARHMDRLIPNYVVKQFATRGLFFLGYSPRNWEDRLLVNAILDKRRHQQYEPAHVITQESDPFVRAYWDSRSVHRYEIALPAFVRKLEAYVV
jgi:hypothetical protein